MKTYLKLTIVLLLIIEISFCFSCYNEIQETKKLNKLTIQKLKN